MALFALKLVAFMCLSSDASAKVVDPRARAILKKARSHIGDEVTLNKIESLRFQGKVTDSNGNKGTLEIAIQKPYQSLQRLTINNSVTEFGLNDYEAWIKIYKVGDEANYGLVPANPDQLRRTRANAFENLTFFSEKTGFFRKIEYLGKDIIDGAEVEKVKVKYGSIFFDRYFDSRSGELVFTKIESGEGIKENGEMFVDGIRFPESVTTILDGQQRSFVQFDLIEVNPVLEDSLFQQPPLPGLKKE